MGEDISFEKFKFMISESMGIDAAKIDRETSFIDDLGVDSLSLVNFIIKVEKQFNIKFNIENAWILKNVGEVYDTFIGHLEK